MGGILSRLGANLLDILHLGKTTLALATRYKTLLRRASSDPGLPVEKPTLSYWMQDPPRPELLDLQDDLPDKADIVVIGSGITGAAAVRTICELSSADEARDAPVIVVLEARQLCSGATARNGGHIKCAPHLEYAHLVEKLGAQKAAKIVKLQLSHLAILKELGAQIVEGEVRTVETVDLFINNGDFDEVKRAIEAMKRELPDVEVRILESAEARDEFGVNRHVVGAVSYDAGALWPFRLITGVWHQLRQAFPNLTISTHTCVESVSENASLEHPFLVHTPRGDIHARHVLHATNGYAGHLVPVLRGCLTGVLGHMTAQRPGNDFPQRDGESSWSVVYSPGFDYVTQRPNREDGSPGDLMVGGGLARSKEEGLDQFGVWDDGRVDTFPLMHLRGSMPTVFEPAWGLGSELLRAWTGIMGFTGDILPFVGLLPPKRRAEPRGGGIAGAGQWIAAGFNGEGMVWAWLSGTAVGLMILGKENDNLQQGSGRPGGRLADWFPVDECAVDEARLERADLRNLKEWM